MKRVIILIAAVICFAAVITGCGRSSVIGVSMAAQEYVGSNIYELPRFDGKGDAVDQLNAAIQQELTHYISGWESVKADGTYWYEIKSYPICTERYKQVVVTAIEYPNYATDGDVYSFCYDIKKDAILTLDDALKQAGVSRETVEQRIDQLMRDYLTEGDSVADITYPAFAFAGGELYIVARAFIENNLTSEHDELFVYNTATGAITDYCGQNLFPAGLCDQFDPALSYGRE